MRWVLAALLLFSLAPLPTAQAASWSVDATVAVTSGNVADYTWKINGLTNTRLTLPLPDNGTFVEARDVDGRELKASADASDVEVTAGSKAFTIKFRLEGHVDGPFVLFPAQVAAGADSPVSVQVTLPAGWSYAGSRCTVDADACDPPDARGRYAATGPLYAEFLVAPAGVSDPGPDTRVAGNAVRREAFANITERGVAWSLVTTYDADVYSRDWEIDVPAGATVTRVRSPFGDITSTRTTDGIRVRTPYPVGYGLGGRAFTVEMELPAPEAHGGAFLQSNLSVRAACPKDRPADCDHVMLLATLPASAQYAGARVAGGSETAPLSFAARGPLSVGIAFLPPAASGHVQFTEGAFVVDAPSALASAARATARNATDMLPRAAAFAYDEADDRPFFVAYTDAPIFAWEEGFYSNGLNTISIRTSTLADAADGRAHLTPVGVLVHEATHALIDRRIPDAPHNLSFLHEGLSRLAETIVESAFPDEIVRCRQEFLSQQCDRHSARPAADEEKPGEHDVYLRYRAGRSFDIAWTASSVSDAERGALYDYSGLVLHAYTQRAPPGALENALVHVARTTFPGPDATDAAILTEILLDNAPGTSAQALLYPGAEAASLSLDQFRFCMGDLLAPNYPWEDAKRPGGGCPTSGYGPRTAALPTPPIVTNEPVPATSAPPPPPPPRISPPITGEEDTDGGSASVPGAVIEGDDGDAPPQGQPSVQVEVPGPSLALLGALVVAVALARRR